MLWIILIYENVKNFPFIDKRVTEKKRKNGPSLILLVKKVEVFCLVINKVEEILTNGLLKIFSFSDFIHDTVV